MKFLILFTFMLSTQLYSYEYPYNPLDKTFVDKAESLIEVSHMTPVKAQDGLGLCYGFTATSLLENFRCRELKLDCSDPKEILSSLDVSSYYGKDKKKLMDGGHSITLLRQLKGKAKSIAREECIPYSSMVHQMTFKKKTRKNEEMGWNFLTTKWNEYKGLDTKQNDCVSCLTNEIKKSLVNLKTPAEQISMAFKDADSVEEFIYRSVMPIECLDEKKAAALPDFKVITFPDITPDQTKIEEVNQTILTNKVISLINSNTPVEMSICADKAYTFDCADKEGHSIVLTGLKEVCSTKTSECRKMVKVKNSYGKNWQDKNNNGWIDLDEVVRSSLTLGKVHNIGWIEKEK